MATKTTKTATEKTTKPSSKKNYNEMEMIAGLDIGNGYVKGKLSFGGDKPKRVDLPSCISYTGHTAWLPSTLEDVDMNDFVNELDCDISSFAINGIDEGRIIVGNRAVSTGRAPIVFNISERKPKCDDALSIQLVLTTIAAEATKEYWEKTGELPTESLQVNVVLSVALPFADYTQYADRYRDMLEGRHSVYIYNFADDIAVNITFTKVVVLAEGQAAQYAITALGADFMENALEECRAAGALFDEKLTGDALAGYENTVGIDIGEGTVNYPVFRNGRIAVESSSTINKGYGSVLESVMEAVRNEVYAPSSRKELDQQLRDENPKPHLAKIQAQLTRLEEEETRSLVRDILDEFKSVIARVKFTTDVIYVFGGGASRVREQLYPLLVEACKLADDAYIPVIYLDSEYSRDLNRNGLYQVAAMAADEA